MSAFFRRLRVLSVAVVLGAALAPLPGCGESEPPPMTPEKFEEAKKGAEVIIQKEHGAGAFQKGQAGEKKARPK